MSILIERYILKSTQCYTKAQIPQGVCAFLFHLLEKIVSPFDLVFSPFVIYYSSFAKTF